MNFFENACIRLRHAAVFRRLNFFWNGVRPAYNAVISLLGRKGLKRTINGTDTILVGAGLRQVPEVHEPEVWSRLVGCVRTGDTIVDVGAHIGLYAVALAKRVGPRGKVFAFEPDPENFRKLKDQVTLNRVENIVCLTEAAVSSVDGFVSLEAGRSVESKISKSGGAGTAQVAAVALDTFFKDQKIDLMKIDVEGYEEEVLISASRLLSDPLRKPRSIFIEMHPFAWHLTGSTSGSLLGLLRRLGYRVEYLDGTPALSIDKYGEVIAIADHEK